MGPWVSATCCKPCFLKLKISRTAECDSCGGRIGGARLFCLDCANKSTESYDSLDLCCAPKCVVARVTHRKDLQAAHEPNHRLVKFRTNVLFRSHGRVYTAACDAFERVGEARKKIAGFTSHSDEETRSDGQKTSSPEPTSTEMPTISVKIDDVLNPLDGTNGGTEVERKIALSSGQGQVQDQDWPMCGKCERRLSFPFWYCIFCEGRFPRMTFFTPLRAKQTLRLLDNLFICDTCDTVGVPDLVRSSGKHTEEHHLIRCLAPEKADDEDEGLKPEQRLTSIEGRLNGIQTQLGDLTGRVGDITGRMEGLTGYIGDLNARMGNIEQLLYRLVGAPEGRTT